MQKFWLTTLLVASMANGIENNPPYPVAETPQLRIEVYSAFSGPKQPPNPEQKSHPIRRNPASVPEQNSHRPFVGLG